MLTLDLSSSPEWRDLIPGVRLKLRPLTTALMVAARKDADVARLAQEAGTEEAAIVMAKAVARIAILDWEGIGDAAGKPIPVTPDAIDALLDLWPAFEAFQTQYVAKALLLDAEKNVSPPLPIGSSAGATAIARPARAPAKTARKSKTRP